MAAGGVDYRLPGSDLSAGEGAPVMMPVPFPEPYRTILASAGGEFRSWGAPQGHDSEVAPTEACTYRAGVISVDGEVSREDQVVTSVVIELDDDAFRMISETRMFEFGVWGEFLPVFFFNPLRSPDPEEVEAFESSRGGEQAEG